MVDSYNSNDAGDKVGKLSDGLLRLVEETDADGHITYNVETVDGDELVYSSVSKAHAFSFCEGYRCCDGKGDTKTRKPKADDKAVKEDSDDKGGNNNAPVVDPAKVQRKRMVF